MRKYTLCFHSYFGYSSYFIEFKRVNCKPERLKYYAQKDLHFVINGWPTLSFPDGTPYFKKDKK